MLHGPAGARPLSWRALGRPHDLDLDFAALADERRGDLVTRVLVSCADGGADEAAVRALTLAGRVGALAAIVARTGELSALPLTLRCPACGAALALELPLDALLELARAAEGERIVAVLLPGGRRLRVRRPTGEDERRWQERRYESPAEAERAVLLSLLEEDVPLDAEAVSGVGEAMSELDPLPALTVASRCPDCGLETDQPVDTEALLLLELARAQRALLGQVHRLALRYGWTEEEVLAIPGWRRRAYLSLGDEATP